MHIYACDFRFALRGWSVVFLCLSVRFRSVFSRLFCFGFDGMFFLPCGFVGAPPAGFFTGRACARAARCFALCSRCRWFQPARWTELESIPRRDGSCDDGSGQAPAPASRAALVPWKVWARPGDGVRALRAVVPRGVPRDEGVLCGDVVPCGDVMLCGAEAPAAGGARRDALRWPLDRFPRRSCPVRCSPLAAPSRRAPHHSVSTCLA